MGCQKDSRDASSCLATTWCGVLLTAEKFPVESIILLRVWVGKTRTRGEMNEKINLEHESLKFYFLN